MHALRANGLTRPAPQEATPETWTMEEATELLLGMGLAPSRGWLRGAFASYDTSGDGVLDAAEMEYLQEVRARVPSPTPNRTASIQ